MFADNLRIIIQNVRGIKRLEFDSPTRHGVYALTGINGCGKTTLLTALARIGDSSVLNNHFHTSSFDDFANAKISYHFEKDGVIKECVLQKAQKRWNPIPKNFSLVGNSPFADVIFISTSHQRFVESSILEHNIEKTEAKSKPAATSIREGMSEILDNPNFKTLRYQTIKNLGAGARTPLRGNKVYYATLSDGKTFSEINFSFGERMVLNTLEIIDKVKEHSLLLIDEIELALHPVAQLKFYKYLKRIAAQKKLLVFISTHSPSLIKAIDNRIYLEASFDDCEVVLAKSDCHPAYILRDITFEEDLNPDYLMFVEDHQAQLLLDAIIKELLSQEKCSTQIVYRICPVAGWEETIRLTQHFASVPPFTKKKVFAFPDADAADTIKTYRQKDEADRTDAEKRRLNLWDDFKSNIIPLIITPELGIWNWMNSPNVINLLETAMTQKFGNQAFRLKSIVNSIKLSPTKGKNDREIAKHRLMDLQSDLQIRILEMKENDFYRLIYQLYVSSNYDMIKAKYKQQFCQILHL